MQTIPVSYTHLRSSCEENSSSNEFICKVKSDFRFVIVFASSIACLLYTSLFELFGVQAVTPDGVSVTLPAPLSDINGAIALGCLS